MAIHLTCWNDLRIQHKWFTSDFAHVKQRNKDVCPWTSNWKSLVRFRKHLTRYGEAGCTSILESITPLNLNGCVNSWKKTSLFGFWATNVLGPQFQLDSRSTHCNWGPPCQNSTTWRWGPTTWNQQELIYVIEPNKGRAPFSCLSLINMINNGSERHQSTVTKPVSTCAVSTCVLGSCI